MGNEWPAGIRDGRVIVECQWWAACQREATKVRDHPVLGAVPICRYCQDTLERMGGDG